ADTLCGARHRIPCSAAVPRPIGDLLIYYRAVRGELDKRLTLFNLTMLAVGSSIGSGIFLTPGAIAKERRSPSWILAVWAAGGLMSLTGALTFAELGARIPRAGGVYVYLSRAYGSLIGFLYGWAYFLVVTTGAIAALSVAFATYVGYFVPLDVFAR